MNDGYIIRVVYKHEVPFWGVALRGFQIQIIKTKIITGVGDHSGELRVLTGFGCVFMYLFKANWVNAHGD